MRERGLSFKHATNEAIRAGLGPAERGAGRYTTPPSLGRARVDLVKALSLAGAQRDDRQQPGI
jgi:hypothetical protein